MLIPLTIIHRVCIHYLLSVQMYVRWNISRKENNKFFARHCKFANPDANPSFVARHVCRDAAVTKHKHGRTLR
jgi:hypothetical protein